MARRIIVLVLVLARAAAALADDDIHFLAEHVVESGMDAVYMSLPWPTSALTRGRWQPSVDLSRARATAGFMESNGTVVEGALARGVSANWGYEVIAAHGTFAIAGGEGRAPLTRNFLGPVPLDLPQSADFSEPRGTQTQFAVGAAAVHERSAADGALSAQLIAGALLERVEIARFAMNYRLLDGGDAGSSGTLAYDSRATFVTPFVAWQRTRTVSARWTWASRAMLVAPLPPRDLDARLTGPQFDLSTPPDADAIQIGDSFVVLGLAFGHRPTGLEIDLGGLLYYPEAETASHRGVNGARVLHIAWRRRTH